jgi:hypothetical protein
VVKLNRRKELKWKRYILENNDENKVIELNEAVEMKDIHIEKQFRSNEVSELSRVAGIKDL